MEVGKVSIVIPTYNHGRFVVSAVESALAQSYASTEVLVVDDGSTDNTRDVLAAFAGRIKYIYQENRGLSAARNTGIRAATGEFIALLDADDMWLPEKLAVQMDVFSEYSDAGLVSCGNVVIDALGRQVSPGEARGVGGFRFRDLLRINGVSGGSNAVVKRLCFDAVGLFDESLRSSEDWDMWLRIAMRYPVRFTQQILVKVRVGANSMSAAKNADTMLANELRVLDKLFSDPGTKVNAYDRGMAYSCRYVAAAWAYHKVGNWRDARVYIGKAFRANPVYFLLRKGFCGLALRIVMGRGLGKSET
jgi:glycosyltransferase involved in cell wall biosynthesis